MVKTATIKHDENWMVVNEKLIQTILNLLKGPQTCIIEKYIYCLDIVKIATKEMRVKALQINLMCLLHALLVYENIMVVNEK